MFQRFTANLPLRRCGDAWRPGAPPRYDKPELTLNRPETVMSLRHPAPRVALRRQFLLELQAPSNAHFM
jgi:hypothetical protein